MEITKTILRWGLLVSGVALCLVYLNSAFYRAWVSGGPPSDNPEGWLFSATNYLSWSLAFLSAGIGAFFLIRKLPSLSKFALAFIVLSIILSVLPMAREFIASDICLDSGGKWLSLELRCTHE